MGGGDVVSVGAGETTVAVGDATAVEVANWYKANGATTPSPATALDENERPAMSPRSRVLFGTEAHGVLE